MGISLVVFVEVKELFEKEADLWIIYQMGWSLSVRTL